jgi:hypothetical protein
LTIADAEDAFNDGLAQVEKFAEEFDADWYAPLGKSMLSMWWSTLDDPTRAQLQARNPQAFDDLMNLLGG